MSCRSAGQTRLSYAEHGQTGSLSRARRGLGSDYRGTLSLVSPDPVALPLLLDGRRTTIPTLHARGRFALRERQIELDFFIVPDPAHPLLLKIMGHDSTWQVLRVDLPGADAGESIERRSRA